MMRQSPLSSSAIQCVFSNITHVSGLRLFLRRSLSLCPRVCIQVSVSEFYFSSFRINTAATSGSLMMYEHLCCLIISAFWLSNFVDPVSGKVYTNIIRGTLSLPFVPCPTQESLLFETSRSVTTDVTFLVYLQHVRSTCKQFDLLVYRPNRLPHVFGLTYEVQ